MKKIIYLLVYFLCSFYFISESAQKQDALMNLFSFPVLKNGDYKSKEILLNAYKKIEPYENNLITKEINISDSKYLFFLFSIEPLTIGWKEVNGWSYNKKKKKWELFFAYTFIAEIPNLMTFCNSTKSLSLSDSPLEKFRGQEIISLKLHEKQDIFDANNLMTYNPVLNLYPCLEYTYNSLNVMYEKIAAFANNNLEINNQDKIFLQKTHFNTYCGKRLFFLYPVAINGQYVLKLDGWLSSGNTGSYSLFFTTFIKNNTGLKLIYNKEESLLKVQFGSDMNTFLSIKFLPKNIKNGNQTNE